MSNPTGDALLVGTARVLEDIRKERQRVVVVEGRTREEDDRALPGRLSLAAMVYAYSAACDLRDSSKPRRPDDVIVRDFWPMPRHEFKPKTPRKDLLRAAQLIVAEIERIDRKEKIYGFEDGEMRPRLPGGVMEIEARAARCSARFLTDTVSFDCDLPAGHPGEHDAGNGISFNAPVDTRKERPVTVHVPLPHTPDAELQAIGAILYLMEKVNFEMEPISAESKIRIVDYLATRYPAPKA